MSGEGVWVRVRVRQGEDGGEDEGEGEGLSGERVSGVGER